LPELVKKKSKKVGLPPGSIVHIGNKRDEKVKITIVDYSEAKFQEKEAKSVGECFPYKDKSTITWIIIDGVHVIKVLEEIGKHFYLNPLFLDDIVDNDLRLKI